MIKTDTIRLLYKELFTIRFTHSGFETVVGNDIFSAITVVPDTKTEILFRRAQIGYRCINDSIVCFTRSELLAPPAKEPKAPYSHLEDALKIRLLLKASPRFLFSTYVTVAGSKTVYYFNNRINNVQAGKNYVSNTFQAFNAGNSYDEGTIVSNAGELFVTLKPIDAADSISISDTAFWKKITTVGLVVNNADLHAVSFVEPGETCFAVIDVFNSGTTNNNYNLIGAGNELLSPVYHIAFKSKIT